MYEHGWLWLRRIINNYQPGRRAQHRRRGSRSQKGSQQSSSPTPRCLETTLYYTGHHTGRCSPEMCWWNWSTLVEHQAWLLLPACVQLV